MDFTTLIMLVLAGALTVLAYFKTRHFPVEGFLAGGRLLWEILPKLLLAFVAAGMISIVLPREFLSRWLGDDSGLGGLVVATAAGAVTPGGPFVQFPIVAALYQAGAGIAPLMAYITAWSLLGVNRFLVYEVPLLGWRLAACRMAASLVFPVVIGVITRLIWLRIH